MNTERWRQVEGLYSLARQREPAERSAFLNEACRGDGDQRREVESLLASEQCPSTQLDRAVWDVEATDQLTPGTWLGVYRIESVLGEGGMGVVYLARDSKLDRPVAVKVLSEDLADPTARRRFQREAQMVSSLNHPHILTVYDVGEFEGKQYLITEFVDGGTLEDWIRAEKRTWRQVVDLLVGCRRRIGGSTCGKYPTP